MKKIVKSILLVLIILLSCSCNKKEYKLIELTSNELLNHLLKDNSSITFVTYNNELENNDDFITNVQKVSKRAKENIYYLDINHISANDNLVLYEIMGNDFQGLRYYVYQNGKFIIQKSYSDFTTLFNDLNGKKYKDEPKLTSDEDKKKYLDSAALAYEEGKISSAYDLLNMAWTLNEAKKTYQNNNLYNIINEWESYEVSADGKSLTYTKIMFYSFSDTMYIATKTDKVDGFQKPSMLDYKSYNYYIKDNYIYLDEKNNGNYKKTYLIDYLDNEYLTITKRNQTYKFFALKEE